MTSLPSCATKKFAALGEFARDGTLARDACVVRSKIRREAVAGIEHKLDPQPVRLHFSTL